MGRDNEGTRGSPPPMKFINTKRPDSRFDAAFGGVRLHNQQGYSYAVDYGQLRCVVGPYEAVQDKAITSATVSMESVEGIGDSQSKSAWKA